MIAGRTCATTAKTSAIIGRTCRTAGKIGGIAGMTAVGGTASRMSGIGGKTFGTAGKTFATGARIIATRKAVRGLHIGKGCRSACASTINRWGSGRTRSLARSHSIQASGIMGGERAAGAWDKAASIGVRPRVPHLSAGCPELEEQAGAAADGAAKRAAAHGALSSPRRP